MCTYRRVTWVDRCHIFESLRSGKLVSEIVRELGFNKSTIYRELKRNRNQGKYNPNKADNLCRERVKRCRRRKKITGLTEDMVTYFLFEAWTPDEIAGRMKREKQVSISAQSIYNFIYRDRNDLKPLLKRYNRRGAGRIIQQKIKSKDRLSIHSRIDKINNRQRLNDFERDCMRFSGIKQEVLVCTDRKSRYTKIALAEDMRPRTISKLTLKLIGRSAKSITEDNGLEFRDRKSLKIPVYQCDPGRPDQRGTVENTIGRMRLFLNLKIDPHKCDLNALEKSFNHTPRKCLNYKTPYEVYFNKKVALAS